MNRLISILAWFLGEGNCPSCGAKLYEHEAGYHACRECSAAVDFSRGCWSFPDGKLRQLPGVFGMAWDEDEAA